MQPPCSGDMHDALLSPNATHHQIHHQNAEFDPTSTQDDDFFDQMLSSPIPSSPRPGVLDLNPNNTCSYDDSMILASMISGGGDGSVQALLKGFAGALHTSSQPQHFHQSRGGTMPMQSFGGPGPGPVMKQGQTSGGGGSTASQAKQKVRARRGQATDPHSIAERLRRERIAERMKALQELVPNANKTDKASMLDEIIDYVKFLQLQVKVLSMSRLGGGGAAPLLAGISSQDGGGKANRRSPNGTQANDDSLTVTEHQVAKLMEEDMGSAMQYLQGKGLCLMPISLATAISTATATNNNPPLLQQLHSNNGEGPTSPAMSSGLTVQSATLANGGNDCSAKDAASVSKP